MYKVNIGDKVKYEIAVGEVVGFKGMKYLVKFPEQRHPFMPTEVISKEKTLMLEEKNIVPLDLVESNHFFMLRIGDEKGIFKTLEEVKSRITPENMEDAEIFSVVKMPKPTINIEFQKENRNPFSFPTGTLFR